MKLKKLLLTAAIFLFLGTGLSFAAKNAQFSDISASDFVKSMQFGWNLGNTMDADGATTLEAEKSWGQPYTTKAMIDGLAAAGIKTLRIPTTWHMHFIDDNLTIDPKWMARVKQIVDWGIEAGLTVILNDHHDNAHYKTTPISPKEGYYPLKKDKEASEKFFTAVWTQISKTFNNEYDEHLIFETMNEPRLREDPTGHEWWFEEGNPDCDEAMKCVMAYNQLVVNTIRASGGNNVKRFIMVPSICASPDSAFSYSFQLPEDPMNEDNNRIILSVHMYTPYDFAMKSPGDIKLTKNHKMNIKSYFDKLFEYYIDAGTPVVIGETGATNKNNLEEREAWFGYFVEEAAKYGMPCVLWDNGSWKVRRKDFAEKYGYYNRSAQTWYFPSLIKIAVEKAGGTPGNIPQAEETKETK